MNKGLNSAKAQVEEFHRVFGHPINQELTSEDKFNRLKWIQEEVVELHDAINNGEEHEIDALIDIMYFVLGWFVQTSRDPQLFFNIVHQSNMNKLGPDGKPIIRESDGKIMKPKGWIPPEETIKAAL